MSDNAQANISETGECLAVDGRLDFDTAAAMAEAVARKLDQARGELRIDLSEVTYSNSAGVALLLDWLRRARARGIEMRFTGVPDSLMAMVRLAHLEQVLPIDQAPLSRS